MSVTIDLRPETERRLATRAAQVGLTLEQYLQQLVEREAANGADQAPPAGPPQAATPECKPLRQRVRDLPLPPEVAAEAKRYGKQLGYIRAKHFRELEEQMKIQHYYGGMWIAYLRTDEGPVVVAAAKSLSDPVFDQQLAFLTAEERRSALIETPTKLFDEESEILTPFADES